MAKHILDSKRQAWSCTIGVVAGVEIPPGGDAPMRAAIGEAFRKLTGQDADAMFTGWGTKFTGREIAVIQNRPASFEEESESFVNWINEIANFIYQGNVAAGWWSDLETGQPKTRNVGELLMLCVSELAEAMEGHRKGLMDDKLPHRPMFEVECADAVIRIFDMACGLGFDLGGAVVEKLAFNRTREDHKIEARKKTDGKKY